MSDAFSFKDYFAARGSRFTDKDAKIIGPALENLNAEGKGTAADIVDAARPDDAPLHRYFEWDDGVAAERYRETQARHMAASIVVRVVQAESAGVSVEPREMRAFHPVRVISQPSEDAEEQSERGMRPYTHIAVIRDDAAMAAQIIQEARAQLVGWQRRYQVYRTILVFDQELGPVFDAIEQINGERAESAS